MTSAARPKPSSVLDALRALQLVPAVGKWSVHPISRNLERIDAVATQYYVVSENSRPRQVLCVGRDLSALVARNRLFAGAYPDLACPVQGEGRHQDWHYVLMQYFAGRPAIDVLHHSAAGAQRVVAALEKLAAQFRAAEQPSTPEAARAEIDDLASQVLPLPYWTPLDRAFLETCVVPYLKEQLVPLQPTRRVTNGDFILRNLLLAEGGDMRLIDYEYGADTHFHAEDWLRLVYWDVLPDFVRGFALRQAGRLRPLRVYLALKQLVLEARTNLPQKAAADAHHWTDSIRQVITSDAAHGSHSVFWPASEAPDASLEGETQAQLFWMTDAGWSSERSLVIPVRTGPHQVIRFVIPAGAAIHALRFDPLNCPGVVTIFNLTVRKLDPEPTILISAFGPEALAFGAVSGDAFTVPAGGENYQIVSTGNDPQIHFNQTGGPADSRLEVEITFSLSLDALEQAQLLRKIAAARPLAGAADALAPSAADRTGEIAALAAQLHRWFTGEDGLRARLTAEFALQRKADQAEHATNAKLSIAQSLLEERNEDLRQLREQLTGYATTIDRLELALAAANERIATETQKREESLGHHLSAADQLGRASQQLAAANERATMLAAELEALRKPRN